MKTEDLLFKNTFEFLFLAVRTTSMDSRKMCTWKYKILKTVQSSINKNPMRDKAFRF